MWNIRNGRLYCDEEPVAVRRVVVEMVMRRRRQPPTDPMVRHMIRMERALSLRSLTAELTGNGGA